MNKGDLHNICVLAIDGYGEPTSEGVATSKEESNQEGDKTKISLSDIAQSRANSEDVTYRGNRDWRDAVGGATLCCNLCCSTLGYVSIAEPDACRVLKHRVRARSNVDGKFVDHFLDITCGSFIGKELIRYSESQAVFTFAVFGCQSNGDVDRCLLLKVLSWNTVMATKSSDGELDFRRVVKVVFDEADAGLLSASTTADGENDDPMTFSWGGVDLCCPPNRQAMNSNTSGERNQEAQEMKMGQETKVTKASVNLYLSSDEFEELRDELVDNNKFFSTALSSATVMLKLGVGGDERSGKPSLSFFSL